MSVPADTLTETGTTIADRTFDQLRQAIVERDGELAEWLMRRHIRASRRAIEQRLANAS